MSFTPAPEETKVEDTREAVIELNFTDDELRTRLKELSVKLYGSSSRWRKMLERGYLAELKESERKLLKENGLAVFRIRKPYTLQSLYLKLLNDLAQKATQK